MKNPTRSCLQSLRGDCELFSLVLVPEALATVQLPMYVSECDEQITLKKKSTNLGKWKFVQYFQIYSTVYTGTDCREFTSILTLCTCALCMHLCCSVMCTRVSYWNASCVENFVETLSLAESCTWDTTAPNFIVIHLKSAPLNITN